MKPDQTNAEFELSCALPIEGMQTSYNWTIEVSKNDLASTAPSSSIIIIIIVFINIILLVGPSLVAINTTPTERVRTEGN